MKTGILTKNVILLGSAAVALLMLVGANQIMGYWQGVKGLVRQELHDATSIKFNLAKLDQQIKALAPQMAANRRKLIDARVAVDGFADETVSLQEQVNLADAEMLELRNALHTDAETLEIDGTTYSRRLVEDDLSRRLRANQNARQRVESRKTMLQRRHEAIADLDARVCADEDARKDLEAMADDLNERLRCIPPAGETGISAIEPTGLSDAQKSMSKILLQFKKLDQFRIHSEQESQQYRVNVNLDRRTAEERYDAYAAAERLNALSEKVGQ